MNFEQQLMLLHSAINEDQSKEAKEECIIRYRETSEYLIASKLRDNITKLNSKLPLLDRLMNRLTNVRNNKRVNITYEWIDKFFNNTVFSNTAESHSIPTALRTEVDLSHKFALLFAINNKDVIIHGSFASHLIDNTITYADIDMYSTKDELIFMISYIIYLFLGTRTHILSIPMIINHRQLRVDSTQTSIVDCLRLNHTILDMAVTSKINSGTKGMPVIINTQNPVTLFFNYFKMMQLEERRNKISFYKDNQKKILSSIYFKLLQSVDISNKSLMMIEPYKMTTKNITDNSIEVLLTCNQSSPIKVTFLTNVYDKDFLEIVKNYIKESKKPIIKNENVLISTQTSPTKVISTMKNPEKTYSEIVAGKKYKSNTTNTKEPIMTINTPSSTDDYETIFFPSMSSVFSDQVVEVISNGVVSLYVNLSRNDIYTINKSEIEMYTMFTIMSVLGLHWFFRATDLYAAVPKYLRVIRTIIHLATTIKEQENRELTYRRTKNGSDHHVYNFKSDRIYWLPYFGTRYPIYLYNKNRKTIGLSYDEYSEYLSKMKY